MSKELFNRVATVNIGGREFSYPPFSISFTQEIKINKLAQTELKLYNPAPDTIKIMEGIKKGRSYTYPQIIINAGYVQENGTCVLGEAYEYKVTQQGPNKVLTVKVGDKTSKWANAIINKTWKNTRASSILEDMISSLGIDIAEINLTNDKLYKKFTGRYFRQAIWSIMRATRSEYYFVNGVLTIDKSTPRIKNVYNLTPQTGLLGRPEKTQKGLKCKTLFLYKLNAGNLIKIQSDQFDGNFKIIKGKKIFSTFEKAICDFEAVAV